MKKIDIMDGKIVPAFHPIVGVNNSKNPDRYFEILARVENSDGSILSPAQFLGSIVNKHEVDLVILSLIPSIQYSYPNLKFSFNVTPDSLKSRLYFERLVSEVYNRAMNPKMLMIELVEDYSEFVPQCDLYNRIEHLREIGFKVAMDDFGTGESNLERISKSHFDVIKLSGRFDLNIPRSKKIITEVTKMLHKICDDIQIVIEGVETPLQLLFAKECGIDYVQGYVYGKPSVKDVVTEDFKIIEMKKY
jgi:EAL domain-containing protein (putative c-di-GMP-specific phosphodiesterase class I)